MDFLPDLFFGPIDPKKIRAVECCYRHSLHLPNGKHMVDYGINEEEAKFSLDLIYKMIVADGVPYFNLFNNFPTPFDQIELIDLKTNNPVFDKYHLSLDSIRTTINLARINLKIGKSEQSRQFCNYGLTQLEARPNELWYSMFNRIMHGDSNFCYSKSERDHIQSEQDRIRDDLNSL